MALLRDQKYKNMLNTYSSFNTVPKTLEEVVTLCLSNERLKRLLYYTDRHALGLPRLNQEQTYSLINNQIRIVPKIEVDPDVKPYIIIGLDNFVPYEGQTTFRSISLSIDIICRYDHWLLDDFNLRPYAIAGEIDGMVNNSYSSGSRVADFKGAQQLLLGEDIGGISLYYNLEAYGEDVESQKPDPETMELLKTMSGLNK